jgi:hypothetical protein
LDQKHHVFILLKNEFINYDFNAIKSKLEGHDLKRLDFIYLPSDSTCSPEDPFIKLLFQQKRAKKINLYIKKVRAFKTVEQFEALLGVFSSNDAYESSKGFTHKEIYKIVYYVLINYYVKYIVLIKQDQAKDFEKLKQFQKSCGESILGILREDKNGFTHRNGFTHEEAIFILGTKANYFLSNANTENRFTYKEATSILRNGPRFLFDWNLKIPSHIESIGLIINSLKKQKIRMKTYRDNVKQNIKKLEFNYVAHNAHESSDFIHPVVQPQNLQNIQQAYPKQRWLCFDV